ncbi:PTPA-CTERM sorting domain-containing protein [Pantanalinema rosaneae CENA516]|uniref:PTPA-CTERM sorting domain-containing protein n=1 Tax=Pantanalinema rosaneae TaxID=1620701 RepID=UPI003D6E26B1
MKLQTPVFSAVAIAAALSVIAVAPEAVNAASITHETSSFSFSSNDYDDGWYFLGSSPLPYFNAALGTLNSVTYQILGDSTASIAVTNNDDQDRYISAGVSTYGYAYLMPQGNWWWSGYNNGAYASVYQTLTPGATASDSQTNNWFGSYPSTYTDSYALGQFTGASNFDVNFYGSLDSWVNNVRNVSVSSASTSGLRAAITYDYTPVPTPALLPGLLAMGVAAIRKRKTEVDG